jgi:hypothetical protein
MLGGTSGIISKGAHEAEQNEWHTRSQATLVNPCVDLSSLSFELLNPGLEVGDFVLELFDAVGVGTHSFVKGTRQEIGHGLGLNGSRDGRWLCRAKAIGHLRT